MPKRLLNRTQLAVKNASTLDEVIGLHYVFVLHVGMLVVAIPPPECTLQNTSRKLDTL
jgi:hypothetical protein